MIELSENVEDLARQIAAKQGISAEDAVKRAVEESARVAGVTTQRGRIRDRSPQAVAARKASMERLADDIAAMPLLDRRSPAEIMDELNAR